MNRRLLLAGYAAVMLALLLLPVPASPVSVPGDVDKLAHVGLFLVFAVLVAWNVTGGRGRRLVAALGWATAVAALVEVLQALLPYRSGDPVDLLAGVGGALVGAWLGGRVPSRDVGG